MKGSWHISWTLGKSSPPATNSSPATMKHVTSFSHTGVLLSSNLQSYADNSDPSAREMQCQGPGAQIKFASYEVRVSQLPTCLYVFGNKATKSGGAVFMD